MAEWHNLPSNLTEMCMVQGLMDLLLCGDIHINLIRVSVGEYGERPLILSWVSKEGLIDIVDMLLKAGADVNYKSGGWMSDSLLVVRWLVDWLLENIHPYSLGDHTRSTKTFSVHYYMWCLMQ
jgi:hypothetical protein